MVFQNNLNIEKYNSIDSINNLDKEKYSSIDSTNNLKNFIIEGGLRFKKSIHDQNEFRPLLSIITVVKNSFINVDFIYFNIIHLHYP